MDNSLRTFINSLFLSVSGKNKQAKGAIIKKHTENLNVNGEFSFPSLMKPWKATLEISELSPSEQDITLFNHIKKCGNDLVIESQEWSLHISKIIERPDRVHVFLDRNNAIRNSLMKEEENMIWIHNVIQNTKPSVICFPTCETSNDLTSLRVTYLRQVIEHLYAIAVNNVTEKSNIICISSKQQNSKSPGYFICCGAVLNAITGLKETTINKDEYISIRQNEMILTTQHKYGIRVSSDPKMREFLKGLGKSAATFELLQIKPTSSVKINFNCSTLGSSKGAAFVLYNCARLETILRTYKEKETKGLYPPLPPIEEVDFNLLTHEDEWSLVFNFILGLPLLLESCITIEKNTYEFKPHHICSFLCSMVKIFSQYYRKVKILTEPRKHLLPVMYARLYMLRSLNNTLKSCLHILNIKSVSQM